jgi:hypothetical protein
MPPVASPEIRRLCLFLLCVIVSQMVLLGAASIGNGAADFEYFYKASRWLLDHGNLDARYDVLPMGGTEARGGIEWYLPFVPRLFTMITWMPLRLAGTLWLATNLVVFYCVLRLIAKYLTGLPAQDWAVTQLVPVFFLALFWHWEFRLNQINNLTLLLVLAGFVQWQRGAKVLPGFWLGFAVLLKLTPMLLVVWFGLKRQYTIVAVALATAVCAGPLADLVVFGPDYAVDSYRNWFHTAVERGSHRGLVLDQREMDWRNQGLGAVASRWLHATDYNTHFDNDPRIKYAENPKFINVLNVPRAMVANIVMVLVGATGLGLLWLARRPARDCSAWQLRLEWALFVMAMLWFMPVMRRYHLVWALPSVSVLAACIHHMTPKVWWSRLALVAILCLCSTQIAILTRTLLDTHIVEASGAFLLALPIVALPMVILIMRLKANPELMPADVFVESVPAKPARAGQPARTAGDRPESPAARDG